MARTRKKKPTGNKRGKQKKTNTFLAILDIISLLCKIIYGRVRRFVKRANKYFAGFDLSFFGNNKLAVLIAAFVALIIIISGLVFALTNKNAYDIAVGDASVGLIKAIRAQTPDSVAETLTSAVVGRLSNELGVKIAPTEKITATRVHASAKKISTEDLIIGKIIETIDYQIEALKISLDGNEIATLKNEAEFEIVKARIFAPYRTNGAVIISEGFVEELDLTKVFIDTEDLTPVDTAYNYFGATYVTEVIYEIKSGDTLLPIALKNNTTVEEIRAINNMEPGDERKLRVGQDIKIPQRKPVLSVMIIEEVTYKSEIDYETQTRINPGIGAEQLTLQEGVKGQAEIVARVTYINGAEQSREIISETIITPPINKVIEVGA